MILLEAFETVENSKRKSYEALCEHVDSAVEKNEPGMLFHLLTISNQDETTTTFRWIEVLKDEQALLTHLTAKHVSDHVDRLEAERLVQGTRILIHTGWPRARVVEMCKAYSLDGQMFAEYSLGYVKNHK